MTMNIQVNLATSLKVKQGCGNSHFAVGLGKVFFFFLNNLKSHQVSISS